MQTDKEALLAIFSGSGKAEFIPDIFDHYKALPFPGERYFPLDGSFDPYGTGPDAWGVLWTNLGPDPVVDGNMVAKDFRLFDDITQWRDKVHFPPLEHMPIGPVLNGIAASMHVDREQDVVGVLLLSGQFERLNEMIGMEDALCAFYEEPEEMHAFMDAMCEYKLKCIDLAWEAIHPDVIYMHDDWGANNNMFFSPEIWREFIKPNEQKYADRIHSYGMLYHHHSCGFIEQIVPDLVEIGVDVLDPLMVRNDVTGILKEYGTRITIAGGINNQMIDAPGATEEAIRAEVRRAIDEYAPLGRYIPDYIPTNHRTLAIFRDEVVKYAGNGSIN